MVNTLTDIITYLGIVLVGFLVWAALSPFEVLGWWAGWFGNRIYIEEPSLTLPAAGKKQTKARIYILFLSGIGRVSGETFSYRERQFLQKLGAALPEAIIIDDIFPYSVNNLPLTGQPFFARLWKWSLRRKLYGPHIAGYLINLRNIWQIMISADKRYGPMFNQAAAEVLGYGLMRYGYDPSADTPVCVIGYSGAGQIAVGVASYLKEWVSSPVYIISLGGIFSSDPGLLAADHVYHLRGKNDNIVRYSLFAPGRWSILPASAWNRARRQGTVTEIDMGPMGHTGRGGYLDFQSELPDGTQYVDKTVEVISSILKYSMKGASAKTPGEYLLHLDPT